MLTASIPCLIWTEGKLPLAPFTSHKIPWRVISRHLVAIFVGLLGIMESAHRGKGVNRHLLPYSWSDLISHKLMLLGEKGKHQEFWSQNLLYLLCSIPPFYDKARVLFAGVQLSSSLSPFFCRRHDCKCIDVPLHTLGGWALTPIKCCLKALFQLSHKKTMLVLRRGKNNCQKKG